MQLYSLTSFFFFFNDTATTEIYTLSLHDALPISSDMASVQKSRISRPRPLLQSMHRRDPRDGNAGSTRSPRDRKSTRLNSSHSQISYAVFCLKKKKNINTTEQTKLKNDSCTQYAC